MANSYGQHVRLYHPVATEMPFGLNVSTMIARQKMQKELRSCSEACSTQACVKIGGTMHD